MRNKILILVLATLLIAILGLSIIGYFQSSKEGSKGKVTLKTTVLGSSTEKTYEFENLTALEYHNGNWTLFRFDDSERLAMLNLQEEETDEMNIRQLFNQMLTEFKLKTS